MYEQNENIDEEKLLKNDKIRVLELKNIINERKKLHLSAKPIKLKLLQEDIEANLWDLLELPVRPWLLKHDSSGTSNKSKKLVNCT